VVEELVAQSAALMCVRDKAGDVEEFHRDEPCSPVAGSVLRLTGVPELKVRATLADIGNSAVCVDRGEGLVCTLDWRERRRSNESRLAHVRFPDDPRLHGATNEDRP